MSTAGTASTVPAAASLSTTPSIEPPSMLTAPSMLAPPSLVPPPDSPDPLTEVPLPPTPVPPVPVALDTVVPVPPAPVPARDVPPEPTAASSLDPREVVSPLPHAIPNIASAASHLPIVSARIIMRQHQCKARTTQEFQQIAPTTGEKRDATRALRSECTAPGTSSAPWLWPGRQARRALPISPAWRVRARVRSRLVRHAPHLAGRRPSGGRAARLTGGLQAKFRSLPGRLSSTARP